MKAKEEPQRWRNRRGGIDRSKKEERQKEKNKKSGKTVCSRNTRKEAGSTNGACLFVPIDINNSLWNFYPQKTAWFWPQQEEKIGQALRSREKNLEKSARTEIFNKKSTIYMCTAEERGMVYFP